MSPSEALTPPRPSSRAGSIRTTRSPRAPPMPVFPRTTSQLSTISVETRNHSSSSRKLLSKTYETASHTPTPDISISALNGGSSAEEGEKEGNGGSSEGAQLLVGSSGSSAHLSTCASASASASTSQAQPLSRSSSQSSQKSSRKGKERAVEPDTDETAPAIEGARDALRHIKIGSAVADAAEVTLGKGRTARKYYVLTNAGKPVWCSHHGSEDANLMGIVQALISIFAEDDDRIRSINKGEYQIAFVLKAPLYLFCVSDWGEPEHVLRTHLEYIHLQILSVVSSTQLARAFARRSNFDPSRLLEEAFLTSLVERCQYDFSYLTGTLQPLRINPSLREAAAAALVPPSSPAGILNLASATSGKTKTRVKDLLYVLLIADGHIVTLLRPRRHSIHPSDLHLLLNTLSSSNTLRQGETFLPICFPKFNPAGFVHAYISYIAQDVGLVFVSADKEAYEELRVWKDLVLERLIRDKTLSRIEQSLGHHIYDTAELQCPGLIHFIYKSRQLVQITMPRYPDPSDSYPDHDTLVTMYQTLQDSMSARSGQAGGPLKLLYMRDGGASGLGAGEEPDLDGRGAAYLGWVTRPFELYMCVERNLPKSAVVSAANVVAQWVASEESRLFLKDAPVF